MWVLVGAFVGLAATQPVAPAAPTDSSGSYPSEVALRSYLQGRLLESEGDGRLALGEYVRAYALDRSSVAICRRVAALLGRAGDASSALDFAEKGLNLDPDDPTSLWVKGTSLLTLGRSEEAVAALEQAAAADSTDPDLLRTLARAAESVNRIDLVASAYERLVLIEEDDGEAWFQLAAAQARLGQFEAADRSLAQATELAPVRPGQLFLGGWIDESLGRTNEAVEKYRSHLKVHTADQVARRRLVNLLARNQRWDEALTEAHIVSNSDPSDTDALEVEIELSLRAGRKSAARAAAERLQPSMERDPDRVGRLGAMFVRNGAEAEGIAICDGWAKQHPADPRGALLGARIRAIAKRYTEAIPLARQAARAMPDSVGPQLLLARLHRDAHQPAAAESVLSQVARDHADNALVLLELAGLREDGGNTVGAETAARDALRAEPENARALNFLGYLLADHNRDLTEAEQLITRAVAQDPDNGAYVDSMGWLYFRLGRLEEARRQLERAIALTDGDSIVREHLGDVYRELKLFGEARNQYRLCLAQDASNGRVRAKLATLHSRE